MKFAFFFVLAAISALFADNHCEQLHQQLVANVENQITTVCRVSGIEEGRTDILGFFYKYKDGTPAILLYGADYPVMLYVATDEYVKNAKCIEDDNFRSIRSMMTAEQIAVKLLSHKNCEEQYSINHPETEAHYFY